MKAEVKNICVRRMMRSTAWNLVLQSILISLFIFVVNFDPFSPFLCVKNWFKCLIDWRTWFYAIPLAIVIVSQGIICSKDFMTLQPFYPTRFSLFIRLFTMHSFTVFLLHVVIGYLTPWLYLGISGGRYSRFISNGFNEDRFFLITGCVWISLSQFFKKHFSGSRHLTFLVIQQSKFAQVKSEFASIIKGSLPEVAIPNLVFMVFYYFYGTGITDAICWLFGIGSPKEHISSLLGILNPRRLIALWFLTTIVTSSMNLMQFLFRVYLTEKEEFPIFSKVLQPDKLTLEEALAQEKYPFIYHLAYLDLYRLSRYSPTRRKQIFTLSQPGGHPHTWNSIKKECFITINNFIEVLTSLIALPSNGFDTEIYKTKDVMKIASPKPRPEPVPRKPMKRIEILQQNMIDCVIQAYKYIINKFSSLGKIPLIVFLFKDRKEMKIKHALRHSLPVVWSCHSFSFLAVHSLREDNFGIIQNDIVEIITAQLKLIETLETIKRQISAPLAAMRPGSDRNSKLLDVQCANWMTKSIKRSVYRLSNSFKDYLTDLHLPRDAEALMLLFAEYKI